MKENSMNQVVSKGDIQQKVEKLMSESNTITKEYLIGCHRADLRAIEQSLSAGAEINHSNGHCLVSVISGHGSVKDKKLTLEYLLKKGAKLSGSTETLLSWAVKERDVELVKFFLGKGIKPNEDDGTAIFIAMKNQDQNILSYLFAYGAVVSKDVKEYFEIEGLLIPPCVEAFSHIQGFLLQLHLDTPEAQQQAINYTHSQFASCGMLPSYLHADLE